MNFIIIFAALGIVWIPVILVFAIGADDAGERIGACLVFLALWLLMSCGLFFQTEHNKDVWNDGFCSCGTHWELKGATRSRYGHETKYYACPNCYKEIQIEH